MHRVEAQKLIGDFQSPTNVPLVLAYHAHVAYNSFRRLPGILIDNGAEIVATFDEDGTQALLVEYDRYAVLAFRGTEVTNWRDLWTDIQLVKTDYNGLRLHRGFVRALHHVQREIAPALESVMARGKVLAFTGHSLGGALAKISCAAVKPDYLCTFGAPRIGRAPNLFDGIHYLRVEHREDWVPRLPPAPFAFEHIGEPYRTSCGHRSPLRAHATFQYLRTAARVLDANAVPLPHAWRSFSKR
jgi:hypothetical protein